MKIPPTYFTLLIITFVFSSCVGRKELPEVGQKRTSLPERIEVEPGFYRVGDSKLLQNEEGIWELYVEGTPYDRGLENGALTRDLIYKQEKAFVSHVEKVVPSKSQQKFLLFFLKIFNRKLEQYVKEEYKQEIYGISRYTSSEFDYVAPRYWRTLYFHAAHDIGHALSDLAMVGCTSFAAWGSHSADGKLILGRNFDFYVNDEFSEEKIVSFIAPQTGYKHAIVTWGGMVGAVSGMNEKGLTVTINAGDSSTPLLAKTPISLVAREILQYASNFDEAIDIAKSREVFVSEAIMVGSAEEGSAILIEVSPKKFDVFRVKSTTELMVCSNHFQGEVYQSDKHNLKAIQNSHSQYRFDRVHELIRKSSPVSPQLAAEFLRNREGLNNKPIGLGNEKSINQLKAHHAVIFQPEDRIMWVSANPFQLGAFVAYDLDEVFEKMKTMKAKESVSIDSLKIPADKFLKSKEYEKFLVYKSELKRIQTAIAENKNLTEEELNRFIELNSDFWLVYFTVGEYYFFRKEYGKALGFYENALTKEITTVADRQLLEKRIQKCNRKKSS